MVEIKGRINPKAIISGTIKQKSTVSGRIGSPERVPLPYYEGEYNVIPDWDDIILETEQKSMSSNVTVEKIPYHETSNVSGGITVVIGGI